MLFHAGSKCPREGEIKACHLVDSMMREEMTGCEGRHGGEDRLGGALGAPVKARLGVSGDLGAGESRTDKVDPCLCALTLATGQCRRQSRGETWRRDAQEVVEGTDSNRRAIAL